MEFTYRDKRYNFPVTLNEVKLGQRVAFDQMYKPEIQKMRDEVYKKDEEGNEVEPDYVEVALLNMAVAMRNFSFFSGIPLDEVENNIPAAQVLAVFDVCFKQIYQDAEDIVLQDVYHWNGEEWYLQNPELGFDTDISFNQLITSKQITKQMHELGAGHWEAVRSLAAVYLRRKDEKFDEKWLMEGSERLEMMNDLPMDIALHVAFFLTSLIGIYQKTSPYSPEVEEAEKAQI